jgi:tRNA U34 2-thiouridine synthase MnmA/TrmU
MKAICVFSGGLDSMLAASVIRAQDIDVLALFFETPFFTSPRARKSAQSINLPLKVIDITQRHLKVVRNPKHGYGENLNPCIDCHALMLHSAGEMLSEEGAGFIVTGEVLGQRPMSQNRKALSLVAAESGFEGLILRPLSAKRLPMTIPEREGWVNRDKLMGFSGRSRKPQMSLAESLGIVEYPSPAGGCLLTDQGFSRRLKDLIASRPEHGVRDIELLKLGRHFRLGPHTKLVVGRNRLENLAIQSVAKNDDLLLRTGSIPGPTALAIGELTPDLEGLAVAITVAYSDADDDELTEMRLTGRGPDRDTRTRKVGKETFKGYMI